MSSLFRNSNPIYPSLARPIASKTTSTTRIVPAHGSPTLISSRSQIFQRFPSTYDSSKLSADYFSSHGQRFRTLYTSAVPVARSEIIRADIPDEDDDPKKRYKCEVCERGFDCLSNYNVGYCFVFSPKTMLIGDLCIRSYTHVSTTLEINVSFRSCVEP